MAHHIGELCRATSRSFDFLESPCSSGLPSPSATASMSVESHLSTRLLVLIQVRLLVTFPYREACSRFLIDPGKAPRYPEMETLVSCVCWTTTKRLRDSRTAFLK